MIRMVLSKIHGNVLQAIISPLFMLSFMGKIKRLNSVYIISTHFKFLLKAAM